MAELRLAGIHELAGANRYIAEVFLPEMNGKFVQEAAEPGSAFISAQGADLVRIFAICHEDRTVANDNPVRINQLTLQIEPSRFRHHFAKCRVDVLEHLDRTDAVIWKKRVIGRYDVQGQILRINPGGQPPDPRGLSLLRPGKRSKKERRKPSAPASSPAVSRRSGRSPALPYPPQRQPHNMAIALNNQPDILCA